MWVPFPHEPDTIMNVVTVSGFGCKLITIIMHMIRETISNRMQIVFYVSFLTSLLSEMDREHLSTLEMIFFVFSAQVGAG